MPNIRLGLDAKLYFCAAGIGGTPTWTELTNVKNVTLNLTKGEADVTTRANNGWKATAATLKEGSIEFEMVWDTSDAGFTAIKDAYFTNSTIGMAAMDGAIATAGSQGLWADCMITDFTREEPLEEGKARYIKPEYVEPETGDAAFTFDTTGGSQHITQSRGTVQKYAPSGQTAPDFGGAIGVTHDNVEGVDITVPVFSFSVTRYIAPGDMSATYIANLYALTGKVNAGTFSLDVDGVTMTFQPCECLFLGASGGKRKKDDWEISFRFAASPNATGLTIGTITGVSKKGWEYLWVRYADAEDEAAKAIVKKPVAAYIERVYDEGNFSLLGV